jgi:hypothetical protein
MVGGHFKQQNHQQKAPNAKFLLLNRQKNRLSVFRMSADTRRKSVIFFYFSWEHFH